MADLSLSRFDIFRPGFGLISCFLRGGSTSVSPVHDRFKAYSFLNLLAPLRLIIPRYTRSLQLHTVRTGSIFEDVYVTIIFAEIQAGLYELRKSA